MKKFLLLLSSVLFLGTQVSAQCNANFTWEQLPGTLTIHFTNTSTSEHDITSNQWNFGDGHMGDGVNPNHTYDQPGVYLVCLIIHDSEGCVADVCHEVVVEAISSNCEAGFNWEQIPNTLTIHFINTSTSEHDITSYQWFFGDGHTGDGANPNHTYSAPGTYHVCLVIHDAVGCVSEVCHDVVVQAVSGNCEAAFNWEQFPGTLEIDFNSTSTSEHDIVSYQWNFGDGHMGDGPSPSHIYDEPGVYLVCLIITDETGCVSDVCHEVVVQSISGECEAGFTWEQIPGTLTIHFTNTSTSPHDITSYQWNFGDGHMGDGQNPNHTYDQPGVYLVCLIIHDAAGCVSDVCHEVVVEAVSGDCEAGFTWEQIPGTLTIAFNNTSTSPNDITSYQWNFGDGHMGDGENPHHTYDQPGVYLVCLIIHDAAGCVSDVCHEVVVQAVSGDCEAGFTWEQIPGTLTIHFTNTSTSPNDITSYQWNFGDGHMGDGQNPNHTYDQPGVYLVCLIIHDAAGCVSDVCHEVVVQAVNGECQAGFTWEQIPGTLTIHFTNTSTSPHDITSYQWNFGDGHQGDGANPNHTYAEPGVYVVCLIIHDAAGCVSDVCHEVVVEPVSSTCDAEFTWDQIDTLTIHFNSTSTSNHDIISYQWIFGDGHMGDGQNTNHTYAEPGVYLVCLIIHDNAGCVADVCHEVAVTSPANGANFSHAYTNNGAIFYFNNQSVGMNANTVWYWEFGDGGSSTEMSPSHHYQGPGIYTVCLTMTDTQTGFTDQFCIQVIYDMEIIDYYPEFGLVKDVETAPGFSAPDKQIIEVRYSNPVNNEITLQYALSSNAAVSLALFDISGNRVIRTETTQESAGQHVVTLPTADLNPGIYALQITADSETVVRTILVTR